MSVQLAVLTTRNTGLVETGGETSLSNADVFVVIGTVINTAIGVIGVVMFGYVIYSGFLWLTAKGDSEQTKKASKIMLNAVIGILILLSSAAIANYTLRILRGATYNPVQSGSEFNEFVDSLDEQQLEIGDELPYAPSYNENAVW